MKRFMLDTNICIELIRGSAAKVFAHLQRHRVESVAISSITLAELQYGVAKSHRPERHALLLAQFCAPLAIESFDHRAAQTYGKVRAALEHEGKSIGPMDTLIASHALSLGLTLVTNNEKEFVRVRGLKIDNWMTS